MQEQLSESNDDGEGEEEQEEEEQQQQQQQAKGKGRKQSRKGSKRIGSIQRGRQERNQDRFSRIISNCARNKARK